MVLKKQTVWLLTMLSLMLVLGIYFVNIDRDGADAPGEVTGSQTAEGDLSEASADEQMLAS
ncbi:hypothetical protein [Bacillus sp. JCM 19041]|uniref:hypothetical protein n=1 Tax=Bacillus sp. JCM 19041 TaxID=1460637 RepID=UPI0006CFB9BD